MPLHPRALRTLRHLVHAALLAGALALVLPAGNVWAQNIGQTTGQISGVVVDATGAVLPGVTLTVSSPAMAGNKVVVTDSTGTYVVPALPAGIYRVEAVLDGFTSISVQNIDVRPGQVLKPNIKMSPGMKETVNVVASPVIDVLSTAISSNISAKTIDELPIEQVSRPSARGAPVTRASTSPAPTSTFTSGFNPQRRARAGRIRPARSVG